MELKVNLTADEMMDVVDAVVKEANLRGYDGLTYNEIVDDMLHIVDAALSVMGIEIVPVNENEDEDEEDDPIADMLYVLDDGRTAISYDDACFLMDEIQKVGKAHGLNDVEALEAAQKIFAQIGEDYGIEVVESEKKEPEKVGINSPIAEHVFIHNGKRAIKESIVDTLIESVWKVLEERVGFLPKEVRCEMATQMVSKIFKDHGIEEVVKGV